MFPWFNNQRYVMLYKWLYVTYAGIYASPTSITLFLTSNSVLISWKQTSPCPYSVRVSTMEGYQLLNTTLHESRIMLNMTHNISQVEISSCFYNSRFEVGKC